MRPGDALPLVLLLLVFKHMLIKVMLEPLIGIVDAKLLEPEGTQGSQKKSLNFDATIT